jgi:hypothetical protein
MYRVAPAAGIAFLLSGGALDCVRDLRRRKWAALGQCGAGCRSWRTFLHLHWFLPEKPRL